jgi:arginine repressor
MAFSEGILRLQRIIEFISIDYRSKKEIMAHLRQFNIIISYKTLERDLKQIKEELKIDIEFKRNFGYKCENDNFLQPSFLSDDIKNLKVGFENQQLKIINSFEYDGVMYYNCFDKTSKKVLLMTDK